MTVVEYLTERRQRLEADYIQTPFLAFIREGHKLIEKGVGPHYTAITPDATHKVDILEGMLVGFTITCFNMDELKRVQKNMRRVD